MTGQLPSSNGIYDNAAEFKATTPSFAHYLRNLGYQTALCGKMHFVGPDQLHGFEERLTTDIYPADFGWTPNWEKPLERVDWWYHNLSSVTGAGVAQISNQLEYDDDVSYHAKLKLYQYSRRLDSRPFCLTVSFTHPHDPYVTRPQYWDLYDHQSIPMPKVPTIPYSEQDKHSQRLYDAVDYSNFDISEEDVRTARHAYFANISYLDEQIGALLKVLEDCDYKENTQIVLCADHGDMLGERGLWYKMSFFEGSARVPLIVNAPYRFTARRIDTPVTTHDLLPTLVELAGGDPENLASPIDGSSLVSLADGEENTGRSVYSEYCAEGSIAPIVMLRRGNVKLIYCPKDPPLLFDLQTDPLELNNLAQDSKHAPLLAELVEQVRQQWDFETFDAEVRLSQRCRVVVDAAHRKGRYTSWDFQPELDAKQRFMRNHMDLNELEANARYPKPEKQRPTLR